MKKISILVPCCNVEKYVRECLDSIKAQTYKNLEVICIDDGSTDSTGDIIDEYVAADPRFKVIHKTNSGYGDSMNKGLELCTGDYVGIVESDDWIEPDMYEVLLNTSMENDLDLIHCLWQSGPTGTEEIDEQKWIKECSVYKPLDKKSVFYMQPSIWAALYRRDLLEDGRKVRFLPTPGASFQDASFAFKAYTKSQRFMLLRQALHHYRVNPGSSVSSTGKIYCVIDEWREMARWINEDAALKEEVVKSDFFLRIMYGGFIWNYLRLATVPKLKFLRAASHFFRELQESGLFNLYGFANEDGGKALLQTMNAPLAYHQSNVMETVNRLYANHTASSAVEGKELISVIVPCYNTAKYIQSSLESICRQNYRNLEIICVDDCSTDETPMLIRHIMRKDSRISFLCTEKNSGLSASRNLGIDNCHGEYVVFLDGDDCLMPDAISAMYDKMNDNVDAVVGSAVVGYEGGEALYGGIPESDAHYYTIRRDQLVNVKEDLKRMLGVHVSAWGKLWRRSILEKYHIRFPEGLLYEDANFYWKYVCVASNVLLMATPVCYYQRHLTGSIMSKTFEKTPGYAIQHLLILDDLYEYLCRNKIGEIGRSVLGKVYEPYFWFAWNNSSESEHDAVLSTMCRILKEQHADVSKSLLLQDVSYYEDESKARLFMRNYYRRERRKKRKAFWKKIINPFRRRE